jgi:two-component system, LytTR family, response regulator
MKAIIIDDEPKTLESITYLLNKYCPDVQLCASADNFQSGYQLIRQEEPELIFIDIQINSVEGTGIDLIQAMHLLNCAVIFISGYKDYAVEAFRLNAVDYLLKPVRIDQLIEAVGKAKKHLELRNSETNPLQPLQKNYAFHVPTQNGFVILRYNDIIRCEADGAYTHFYMKDKSDKITSSINLGQVENKLGTSFFRAHKSHIINKEFVVSYSKGEGLLVKMNDGCEVPVSRTQKDSFFKWLG